MLRNGCETYLWQGRHVPYGHFALSCDEQHWWTLFTCKSRHHHAHHTMTLNTTDKLSWQSNLPQKYYPGQSIYPNGVCEVWSSDEGQMSPIIAKEMDEWTEIGKPVSYIVPMHLFSLQSLVDIEMFTLFIILIVTRKNSIQFINYIDFCNKAEIFNNCS